MFPRVQKNFNATVDGFGYAGRATEVKLPDLKLKTHDYNAGGLETPLKIVMGHESLEASIKLAEWAPEAWRVWGEVRQMILRTADQGEDSHDARKFTFTMRGRWYEVTPDAHKQGGDPALLELKSSLIYFKAELAGEQKPLVEIDVKNMIRKVNGVDQLQSMREALEL